MASQPVAAAAGVDVLITMLTDGVAVEQVMTGPGGALSGLGPRAVWIQMSTVGVDLSERLANLAAQCGVAFVDVPVSGSSQPAEDGQRVILASGAGPVRSRVEPVFEVLARQTLWLEQVGDGSRLKLALNGLAGGAGRRNGRDPHPEQRTGPRPPGAPGRPVTGADPPRPPAAVGVQDSTVNALVADLVPPDRRATASGIFVGVQGAGALLGGVAGPVMAEATSSARIAPAPDQRRHAGQAAGDHDR